MKAIILAAGSGIKVRERNEVIPTCLMKIAGKSLLQRQINILNKCGITDIVVIVGQKGNCWNEKNVNQTKTIAKNVIINTLNTTTPSSSSLALGLLYFKPSEVLVMDGDTIFEKSLIKAMIGCEHKNILLLAREKANIASTHVFTKEGRIQAIGRHVKSNEIYSGLMKIDSDLYKMLRNKLKSKKNQYREYTDILNKKLKKYDIYGLHIESIQGNIGAVLDLKPLRGGSFANTKVISKLVKKTLYVVRKEAVEGREKLIDEIKWIKNLPADLKPYFPEILDYDIKGNKVWVEMEYYHLPTLRSLLIDKSIGANEALYLLEVMIKFMFSNVYTRRRSNNIKNYAKRVHLSRIKERLMVSAQKSNIMRRIINSRCILINGKRFYNIPIVIKWIENDSKLLKQLEPPFVSMVHGDLHFDNFLVDISQMPMVKFILFDPRGRDGLYDYTYDLGKLWHSFHSKYDLIHEGLFKIKYKFEEGNFIANMNFTDKDLISIYKKINEEFPKVLQDIPTLKKDRTWLARTRFSEMAHLCSVMPFHMKYDGRERLAIALYLIGVKLANDFVFRYCRKMIRGKIFPMKYVNINTLDDYTRAKELFE